MASETVKRAPEITGEMATDGFPSPMPEPKESSRCFRAATKRKQAKLKRDWPMIKSSLENLGYSCEMSTTGVDCTVSVVSPGREVVRLFKLLILTDVPVPLAIELALHGRQHVLIMLNRKGSLCKKYRMNETKIDKLKKRLKRSLKELGDLTDSTLFLSKKSLTAVGTPPRLCWVRKVLKFCLREKLSPAHVIGLFKQKLKQETATKENIDTRMTEKSDLAILEQPKSDPVVSDSVPMSRSRTFRPIYDVTRARVREAWSIIKSPLEALGYSCSISTVDSTVTLQLPTTADQDIVRKGDYLFKLLLKTPVPAHLAIELAIHGRQHDYFNLTHHGRLFKKYGTKEKSFVKELRRGLKLSLKELQALTQCTLYLGNFTLTAVGPSPRLCWVKKVIEICIIEKLSPAHVIGVFDQKQKQTATMEENNMTTMTKKSDSGVLKRRQSYFLNDIKPFPTRVTSDSVIPNLIPRLTKRTSPRLISKENREKLREAWPLVKSSVEELGIICTTSMDDSTASLVLPASTDLDIRRKIDYLFKLLSETAVPATMAIEFALQGRQHDLIELGALNSGLCKKYGIKKEKVNKLQRRLKCSLKELHNLTQCTIFLNKETLTAVGPSPRLHWIRRILKTCIIEKLSPKDVISGFILKYEQKNAFIQDVPDVKKTGLLLNKDGAAEVTLPFAQQKATRMNEALSMVQSSLEKYGILCTLNMIQHSVTISLNGAMEGYMDAFEKANYLLQLLTTTTVPPSLAIELALNGREHEFIEIGFQEGGLCAKCGIEKEQYRKRRAWLFHSAEWIRDVTMCDIYYSGDTITAVGSSSERLAKFRTIVLSCIVEDLDPENLARMSTRARSEKRVMESINRLLG